MYGVHHRDGWGTGLTILTALANLVPSLPPEETYLALFQGMSRLSRDCDGAPPRRDRQPLFGDGVRPLPQLGRWLRHWTSVRHRDGAERTLLTAIAGGAAPAELATLLLAAVTDRTFADGGHALDFINKSFECVDLIGWKHASAVLPTTVAQLVEARSLAAGLSASLLTTLVTGLLVVSFLFLRLRTEAEGANRRLYGVRMNLGQRFWEDWNGDVFGQTLAEQRPENQGWEWHYWQRKVNSGHATFSGHTGAVNGVAFSADGSRLASASSDGTVKVWETATGHETLTLNGHTATVNSVAFSPDGSRLASASRDTTVKVWDVVTGQETLTLKGHTGPVNGVAFSPDGCRLASASDDKTVKVWDAREVTPEVLACDEARGLILFLIDSSATEAELHDRIATDRTRSPAVRAAALDMVPGAWVVRTRLPR